MTKASTTGSKKKPATPEALDPKQAILTPVFRVSFPEVFEAKAFKDQEAKFSVTMLFDEQTVKNNPAFQTLKLMATAARDLKFGSNPPEGLKSPFRKGEEKPKLDGYEKGMIFVKATSKRMPELVDLNGQPIISARDFYPGCYARAYIVAFGYDNVSKGVGFGLRSIQKVADGEAFDGGGSFADGYGDAPELPEGATPPTAAPADGGEW